MKRIFSCIFKRIETNFFEFFWEPLERGTCQSFNKNEADIECNKRHKFEWLHWFIHIFYWSSRMAFRASLSFCNTASLSWFSIICLSKTKACCFFSSYMEKTLEVWQVSRTLKDMNHNVLKLLEILNPIPCPRRFNFH